MARCAGGVRRASHGGSAPTGRWENKRTLITFDREEIETSGHSRYRSGCFPYSIEEDGEMSSSPPRSFRLRSDGCPETNRAYSTGNPVSRARKIGSRVRKGSFPPRI